MPSISRSKQKDNKIVQLKVHSCRFENLPLCLCSYKNNTLKISHSWSYDFSRYLPLKFVSSLKSRLIFNIYHFWMFVNKLFACLTCAYLKSKSFFNVEFWTYYFHIKTKILADFQICISVPLSPLPENPTTLI